MPVVSVTRGSEDVFLVLAFVKFRRKKMFFKSKLEKEGKKNK